MPASIVSNRPRTSVVLHITPGNTNVVVSGNSTVSSIASPGETLTGAYITQAAWGFPPSGYAIIRRGAQQVAVYESTGQHEYAGCGMPINVGQAEANLSIEFVSATVGFILLELQKVGPDLTSNSQYFQI